MPVPPILLVCKELRASGISGQRVPACKADGDSTRNGQVAPLRDTRAVTYFYELRRCPALKNVVLVSDQPKLLPVREA